ncbi:uncharacterized protein LOC134408841 isoform X2 [Elgaria multicarinata webbii]|uniref:uncharacterized protein LOC134408841 isoform X2 n=1 Tax=Elgaria multicarinata webbii TaxID=159646 RepID=UPI002FCD4935
MRSSQRYRKARKPCQCLDSENSQRNSDRPSYLEPWIVNLLLEDKESEAREDGQLGHVLKVLNQARALHHDEQCPAAVLCIGDGRHYIRVVVTAKAAQMTTSSLPQSGFSSIIGQFIVLQNYRVCFKEATKAEDCEFYLTLDCFHVMPMKRQETRQRDCNQEPSVLQKVKALWQKSFALQPWPSTEPSSVSEILREIKQDQLSTLKQNVEDCLSLLDPSKLLDSEQLAVYPDTKWQVECKQDKVHKDIFTVPAKLLVISAENEAALAKAYTPKISPAVPDTGESPQDDDLSTVSFFSAESESLDGSLENPWDIFPGMTLTSSSDTSSTLPGLPLTQQVLLASTAEEEEAPSSSNCTPDFLAPCAHTSHCTSEQVETVETMSQTRLLSHSNASFKESANEESRPVELNTAHHASKAPDTDESVPCGQPWKNSHSHATMCLPPTGSEFFLEPLSENMEKDHLTHLQRDKVAMRRAGEKSLDRGRKCVAAKRKQMVPDEEEPTDIFSTLEALGQPSARASPKSSKLNSKLLTWKPPLKFVSTPKKSRIEEAQQHRLSAQFRCTERLLEKGREQGAADIATRTPEQHGVQQRECVRGAPFYIMYKPPTPELCSQVRSTRISRALLGWARWVFSNTQKE